MSKRPMMSFVLALALCAGMFAGAIERRLGGAGAVKPAQAKPIGGGGTGPCRGSQPRCFRSGCTNNACPPKDWCTGANVCAVTTFGDGSKSCETSGSCDSNPLGGGIGTVIF